MNRRGAAGRALVAAITADDFDPTAVERLLIDQAAGLADTVAALEKRVGEDSHVDLLIELRRTRAALADALRTLGAVGERTDGRNAAGKFTGGAETVSQARSRAARIRWADRPALLQGGAG